MRYQRRRASLAEQELDRLLYLIRRFPEPDRFAAATQPACDLLGYDNLLALESGRMNESARARSIQPGAIEVLLRRLDTAGS